MDCIPGSATPAWEMETLPCSSLSEVLWGLWEQRELKEREIIYVKLVIYRISCFWRGVEVLQNILLFFLLIYPLFILQLAELTA